MAWSPSKTLILAAESPDLFSLGERALATDTGIAKRPVVESLAALLDRHTATNSPVPEANIGAPFVWWYIGCLDSNFM